VYLIGVDLIGMHLMRASHRHASHRHASHRHASHRHASHRHASHKRGSYRHIPYRRVSVRLVQAISDLNCLSLSLSAGCCVQLLYLNPPRGPDSLLPVLQAAAGRNRQGRYL